MTTFSDIYEFLETVRTYELRPKETLVQLSSVDGTTFGYATADSDSPSVVWEMNLKLAKTTALARGTKESVHIRELLSSYMGRQQLLSELRAGTLEYGFATVCLRSESLFDSPVSDLIPTPKGIIQYYIPGL